MAKEFLFEDSPVRTQWVVPDERGFTLRTRFKGTQEILDANRRVRNDAPKRFGKGTMHHVARVPIEVFEVWQLEWFRMGHQGMPDAEFIQHKLNLPEFKYLKTKEVKL